MSDRSTDNGAYQIINPPNLLKVKVRSDGGAGIDPQRMRQAASVFESMEEEFEDRVTGELARLMRLAIDIEEDPSKSAKIVRKLERICRELVSQGESYDFELVVQIARRLTGYLKRIEARGEIRPEVLRAHADALHAVFKNAVKGSGGEVGMALLLSLDKLIDRMTP